MSTETPKPKPPAKKLSVTPPLEKRERSVKKVQRALEGKGTKKPNRQERRQQEKPQFVRKPHLTQRPFVNPELQNLRSALRDSNVNIKTR